MTAVAKNVVTMTCSAGSAGTSASTESHCTVNTAMSNTPEPKSLGSLPSGSRSEIHYPSILRNPSNFYSCKKKQKLVRLMTVLAYIFAVSLVAIVLSLYYLFLWNPYLHNLYNDTSLPKDMVMQENFFLINEVDSEVPINILALQMDSNVGGNRYERINGQPEASNREKQLEVHLDTSHDATLNNNNPESRESFIEAELETAKERIKNVSSLLTQSPANHSEDVINLVQQLSSSSRFFLNSASSSSSSSSTSQASTIDVVNKKVARRSALKARHGPRSTHDGKQTGSI